MDQPFAYAESAVHSLAVLQDYDDQRRREARAIFDRAGAGAKPVMHWRELNNEDAIHGTARHALLADLVLFGQHEPNKPLSPGVPQELIESVLIMSGRAGLILPYTGSFATVGRNVLIAWKSSRESAHALSAAMALLQRAEQIHWVGEPNKRPGAAEADSLESYLRAQGSSVPIKQHAALEAQSPGEGLLSLAADTDVDLLVMGCYGHSRTREWVLGGASRTILRSMTLPVLMAH